MPAAKITRENAARHRQFFSDGIRQPAYPTTHPLEADEKTLFRRDPGGAGPALRLEVPFINSGNAE